jgi:hypothetical protein
LTAVAIRPRRSLAIPMGASVALHAVAIAVALSIGTSKRVEMPPTYRVRLVAAPVGAATTGAARPARETPARTTAAKPAPRPPAVRKAATAKTPPKTTTPISGATAPAAASKAPATAAGGTGGKGADVDNIDLEGLDFAYPAYLTNIINQIRRNFRSNWPQAYVAKYSFLIRRDGTVTNLRLLDGKGASFDFKLEAQGAIELAGRTKAFGPLPDGFADDVLPIVFTFDPRITR